MEGMQFLTIDERGLVPNQHLAAVLKRIDYYSMLVAWLDLVDGLLVSKVAVSQYSIRRRTSYLRHHLSQVVAWSSPSWSRCLKTGKVMHLEFWEALQCRRCRYMSTTGTH